MNLQKCTQKSLEAMQQAQDLAMENGHPELTQLHLVKALGEQPEALLPEMLRAMNVSAELFGQAVGEAMETLPRQQGGNGRLYASRELEQALLQAEKQATRMGDEYVSVEHLFLGILQRPCSELKKIFARFGITEDGFLAALKQVRGNSRVTSQTPEDTYQALQKYGQDLVELARNRKLDPVIGRDDEIRRVIRILSRKTKNNPCLIGEPGVGKTAIAEGLALRIVRGDVPDNLKDRSLFS